MIETLNPEGVLEAWSAAVGEELTALAGFRFTRLTTQAAVGDTTWHVETTFDWPAAGTFFARGQQYRYSGKTDLTFTGVRWDDPAFALPITGRLTAPATSVLGGFFRNATVRVVISGIWVGTLLVEVSTDGVSWETLTSTTANLTYDAALTHNTRLRVRATALGSGAATVALLPLPQASGAPQPVSGPINAAGGALNTAVLPRTVLGVVISGTWVGTILLEQSVDGVSWATVATYTTNQNVEVVTTQPSVRLRASAWTSGTANLALTALARSGAKEIVSPMEHVVDLSRTFSALDALRAQMFVDTATGDYLSVLGRNLGVRRAPDLSDDDTFRKLIKAIAYTPRGTLAALRAALEAFFGVGNVRVFEDFPAGRRNTVFVQLLNGITLSATPNGGAYFGLTKLKNLNTGTRQVTLPSAPASPTGEGPPKVVAGVRIAPEGRYDTFGPAPLLRPSALTEVPYPGAGAVAAWVYSGTAEGTVTSVNTTPGLSIATSAVQTALYTRIARIQSESRAEFTAQVAINGLSGTAAGSGKQWLMAIRDGAHDLAIGAIKVGGVHTVGFLDTSTGQFLTTGVFGSPVAVSAVGLSSTFSIRKNGTAVELWWNGHYAQSASVTAFPATTANDFRLGHQDAFVVSSNWRVLAVSATTATDFWNLRGANGHVTGTAEFNTASGTIVPGHVGKGFRTATASTNPAKAKNNGQWLIASRIDADRVTLVGPVVGGAVVESPNGAAGPHRVTIAGAHHVFRYPDDVGKLIQIIDSASGNNCTVVISRLMQADAPNLPLTDPPPGYLTGMPSPIIGHFTNVLEVDLLAVQDVFPGGAILQFASETGLHWRLVPLWSTPDTGMSWELADAGTLAAYVLTIPVNPVLDSTPNPVMEVRYSVQESAQLLLEADSNTPAGTWFPLYLPPNPLGPFASYIGNLLVAGVIPEVII